MAGTKIKKIIEQLKAGVIDYQKIAEVSGAAMSTVRVQDSKFRREQKVAKAPKTASK